MRNFSKFGFFIGLVVFFVVGCTETDVQPEAQLDKSAVADDSQNANARIGKGQAKGQKSIVQEVTGTIKRKNDVGMGVPFAADLHIREFVVEGDDLFAVATLNNITGDGLPNNVVSLEGKSILVPVVDIFAGGESQEGFSTLQNDFSDPTCPILNLVLGPLNLDLLGLTVFLDTVTLVIGAEPGGGLLGDLLCAVANLLNPLGGILGSLLEIADLLNQIIDIIGTLV
jgi:hypothetical protein